MSTASVIRTYKTNPRYGFGVVELILKEDQSRFLKEKAELENRNRDKSEEVRRQQIDEFYNNTLEWAQERGEVCTIQLLRWKR